MSTQSSSSLCAASSLSLQQQEQYTRLATHLSWIPPNLRGAMAAYSALGQVGGAHGQHHKVYHAGPAAGSAGTTSGPASSTGLNDACQETKSLTLEWKVSDLKTVFDSSRGDAKSKCIKSPLCASLLSIRSYCWFCGPTRPVGQAAHCFVADVMQLIAEQAG